VDGGWYWKTTIPDPPPPPPPPLVKLRMVRGGPEFLMAVDLNFVMSDGMGCEV
jgi:hypothetical protein